MLFSLRRILAPWRHQAGEVRSVMAYTQVQRRAWLRRAGRWFSLLCAALLTLSGCGREPAAPAPPRSGGAGLFSWSAETVNKTDGQLFELMAKAELDSLYQNFSSDNSRQEQMSVFLEAASEAGITVYDLTGDPSWGADPEGEALCQAVEETAAYNRRIERKFLARRAADGKPYETVPRIAGIVFDVEPYALDEWDEDREKLMNSFVSGMKRAYASAHENGLSVIVCIPWHYDDKGLEQELEALIKDCCDSVAVMNYYRGAEVKNIASEAELAQKYGKELISIYELQKAGSHGLTEANTYHELGIEAVMENFRQLGEAYPELPLSFALHDYKALKELMSE